MSEISNNSDSKGNICVLISERNPEIKFIILDKEPLILGRTQMTGIIDQKLSKHQMRFSADYSMGRVLVEQVGINKSSVNNDSMIKGEKRLIYHGDKISLLFQSHYTYRLNFLRTPNYSFESNKRPTNCLDKDISPKKFRPALTAKWDKIDGTLLVYSSSNIVHTDKIAAFDLDGTIITTQSGKVFPVDYKDWKINGPDVIYSLKKLSEDGYKIVIFTNQGGIGRKKVDEKLFKEKIENIVDVIKTPIQVFVATHNDIYRKPAPGMWNTFESDFNGGWMIDLESSFYCGDAAGRSAGIDKNGRKIKKDHSSCDVSFASNICVGKFYSPEEYFEKAPKVCHRIRVFNPCDVMRHTSFTNLNEPLVSSKREMIIMVGCPASGKSYFINTILTNHKRIKIVSRDILGTWQKCVLKARKYLESSDDISVVIDNTNPDRISRKRYIDIAKSMNVFCRVFVMDVSYQHARHNNRFRQLTDHCHQKVSDAAIKTFFSKFQKPSKSKEGIDEITNLNFYALFKDTQLKKLYKMFLLEK